MQVLMLLHFHSVTLEKSSPRYMQGNLVCWVSPNRPRHIYYKFLSWSMCKLGSVYLVTAIPVPLEGCWKGYILATWRAPAKPHFLLPVNTVNNRKCGLLGVSLLMKTCQILFLLPTDRKLAVSQVRYRNFPFPKNKGNHQTTRIA